MREDCAKVEEGERGVSGLFPGTADGGALILVDDCCLDNRKKTTSALALRLLSSTNITYRNYNINIHNGSTMTGGSRPAAGRAAMTKVTKSPQPASPGGWA